MARQPDRFTVPGPCSTGVRRKRSSQGASDVQGRHPRPNVDPSLPGVRRSRRTARYRLPRRSPDDRPTSSRSEVPRLTPGDLQRGRGHARDSYLLHRLRASGERLRDPRWAGPRDPLARQDRPHSPVDQRPPADDRCLPASAHGRAHRSSGARSGQKQKRAGRGCASGFRVVPTAAPAGSRRAARCPPGPRGASRRI